jgi:hypothetical protein
MEILKKKHRSDKMELGKQEILGFRILLRAEGSSVTSVDMTRNPAAIRSAINVGSKSVARQKSSA